MIVGLTGGIATGKSTVCAELAARGWPVIDADRIAREVVACGTSGLHQVAEVFGADILAPDGELDRARLAGIIFADAAARKTLNGIVHPLVREQMRRETDSLLTSAPEDTVVWDVPLLFEGETKHLVDVTVLVYAPPDLQLLRLMARNGLQPEDAQARIAAQMPIRDKLKLADIVLYNDGPQSALASSVRRLERVLRARRHGRCSGKVIIQ